MKRTSANLKTLARESLAGNFSLPVSAYLLITILTSVLSMIVTGFLDVSNTVSLITSQILIYLFSLLSSLLMAGYDKMILNLNRRQPYTLGNIFYAFSHNPDRFIVVNFLLLLAGILVSLPFDIPSYTSTSWNAMVLSLVGMLIRSLVSIVLAAFFGLANYLLLDYPEMGAMQALKESLRLMKGNKGRYVHLYLSFLLYRYFMAPALYADHSGILLYGYYRRAGSSCCKFRKYSGSFLYKSYVTKNKKEII